MNIAVLGSGSWGTAMAVHLHRQGHTVTLVARRMEQAMEIASTRRNDRYLPGVHIHEDIQLGCELKPAVMEAEVVLLACPSEGLRPLCAELQQCLSTAWNLRMAIAMCKGLESETLLRPTEVISGELPGLISGVLSGPTFAWEIAEGKPGAAVLASGSDDAVLKNVQQALSGPGLRVYRSADIVGVELGGCLKNVYAIGAGICDGLGLGHNAKAAYVTRALAELVRIGTALGGERTSFHGLSGAGDLMATCYTEGSRNYSFGLAIGKGSTPDEASAASKGVIEGRRATDCLQTLCAGRGIDTPILDELHGVLAEGNNPGAAVSALMTRELKEEG